MKKVLVFTIVLAAAFLLSTYSLALDLSESQSDSLGIPELEESIPESAEDILGSVKVSDDTGSAGARILEAVFGNLGDVFKSALKSGAAIILIAVIFSMAGAFFTPKPGAPDYTVLAASLAVAAVAAGNTLSFMGLGKEVINELDVFSKTLLPTLAAASAATGNLSSSAAMYAATVLFMNVLVSMASTFVVPLIYAYTASAAAGAALGDSSLTAVAGFIKWAVMTALTALTIAFTVYLTVTGVISNTADAVTAKVAKTAVSALLPVVGGMISDAAGTVASSISVLKNAVGVFGLIVIAAVCAEPFLRLSVHYLVFKAVSALISPIADPRIGKLVSAIATSLGLILGVAGTLAIMFFISVISVLKAVTVF
ncbi:MAG: hypothetical protein AB7C97_00335 [Oscillospiraceae bacterium]